MGYDQVPGQDDGLPGEENVDVDAPRAVTKVHSALHSPFDILDRIQEVEGRKRGLHLQDLIIEPALMGIAHGLRSIQGGGSPDPDARFREQGPRPAEVLSPIASIASQT